MGVGFLNLGRTAVAAHLGRYRFNISLGGLMQSFWFRIDSLLQKRCCSAASAAGGGGGEGAKGDYLAGDRNFPNWPRSGKVRAPFPPPAARSTLAWSDRA